MKFGLESEKFLFNLKHSKPSEGVFRFIDALTDLDPQSLRNITNEFVLNIVEIVSEASEDPIEVLNQYIGDYLMFHSITNRESVAVVGMGSLPVDYQPHMSPKWPYFVQNCILDKKMQNSYIMTKESPLTPAGNCAGIHIHTEIETLPEYLFSTRELQDKFNLGLMLTPMIAFASSPYFFGEHSASSMRGQRYFNGVYKDFPLNGGLPHVMESSEEVLKFFQFSAIHWIKAGVAVGLHEEELQRLIGKKGASWNPIRWNRTWNTIELRCIDSDRIDLDCSKFIWVTGAMKRTDLKGEALKCKPIETEAALDEKMVDEAFKVTGEWVTILPSHAIKDMFQRSIKSGLKDPLVKRYLMRLSEFARKGVDKDGVLLFDNLQNVLESGETTSEMLLQKFGNDEKIAKPHAINLINAAIDREKSILKNFRQYLPEASVHFKKFFK